MIHLDTDALSVTSNDALTTGDWRVTITQVIGTDSVNMKLKLAEARKLWSMLAFVLGEQTMYRGGF